MPRIDEEGRAAWGSRASGLLAVLLGGDVAAAAGHAGGGVLLLSGGNRGAARRGWWAPRERRALPCRVGVLLRITLPHHRAKDKRIWT